MKVSTVDFIKGCQCRSVGECTHIQASEFQALEALVEAFAVELKSKLTRKMMTKGGWDDPAWTIEDMQKQLIAHIAKGDPLDIAAYAAFWWNRL